MHDIQEMENNLVPAHLRDSSHSKAKQLGDGVGYLYPHNYPDGYVAQDYLPENMRGKKYYQPTERGYEKNIQNYLNHLKQLKTGSEPNHE
jgi:putative ATPase